MPSCRPTDGTLSACCGLLSASTAADAYLQAIQALSQIVTGVDKRKVFVDGDDVCVIYDLKTVPVPNASTAEWYRVRDGKIASIQVFFDARPFAALFQDAPPSPPA